MALVTVGLTVRTVAAPTVSAVSVALRVAISSESATTSNASIVPDRAACGTAQRMPGTTARPRPGLAADVTAGVISWPELAVAVLS
jgi:hypothetical protein